MKWIEYVMQYRGDHPHLSYKQALSQAGKSWKTLKTKRDYTPKLRPKKKETTDKPKMSRKLQETVKEQCGIHKPRALTPKKRKAKPKSTSSYTKPPMGEPVKPKRKRKPKKKQGSK